MVIGVQHADIHLAIALIRCRTQRSTNVTTGYITITAVGHTMGTIPIMGIVRRTKSATLRSHLYMVIGVPHVGCPTTALPRARAATQECWDPMGSHVCMAPHRAIQVVR